MSELFAIGVTAALVSVITIGGPAMKKKAYDSWIFRNLIQRRTANL